MEKTFQRMMKRPSARHAYVQAEVATALAHQVRNLRLQRGWTQRDLAKRLSTTQAAVSRLEDPSYGRPTLKTLLQLSQVFDTGLQVRFVSMVRMLHDTWQPSPGADLVAPFAEEADTVGFVGYTPGRSTAYAQAIFVNSHSAARTVPSQPAALPAHSAGPWVVVTPARNHTPTHVMEMTHG